MEADGFSIRGRMALLRLHEEADAPCLAEPSSFGPVSVGFRRALKLAFDPGHSVGTDVLRSFCFEADGNAERRMLEHCLLIVLEKKDRSR
jgi:hypothetical protein